jgi:hypothetical protein
MKEDKNAFKFDVFLSHNSKVKARVRKLAEQLKNKGLRVWLDEWVIRPGDDIYLQIEKGLEASRVMVLCMTPNAFGSDWVSMERSTVIFRDPKNSNRRFIPLYMQDCTIPDFIRRFAYIDYRQDNTKAVDQLLNACREEGEEEKKEEEKKPAPGEEQPAVVLERKL